MSSLTYLLMPNMSITMTTSSGKVLVLFSATTDHDKNQRQSSYGLFVDGTRRFSVAVSGQNAADKMDTSLSYLVTGLSAGSHTFEIRWLLDIADCNARQLATTWGLERSLVVMELQ
jgi:hypothetical protein